MQSSFVAIRLPHGSDRHYTVAVRPGQFAELPGVIARGAHGSTVFIITDHTVRRLYGNRLHDRLASLGLQTALLSFPPGEKSKNQRTISHLYTQLLRKGVRRDSMIVALGGGVVGDMAGFVAATVLRGIRFIQVPTTLLAQVDSSVGGKVGIDHPLGKNLIGAFHHPEAVYCDPAVLATLPDREFRNGVAEIVKIAAAFDRDFFSMLERQADQISKKNIGVLVPWIARAVRLKAAVVTKDVHETGLRRALNLGHTIGHAVEAATHFRLRHGEAVAVGMVVEAQLAVDEGRLPESDYRRLVRLLEVLGLPTAMPYLKNKRAFLMALAADKKSDERGLRFVLLDGLGCVDIDARVPQERVRALAGIKRK